MKRTAIVFTMLMAGIVSSWATEGYNDLAKLVKSKVSDDVILAFINASTIDYALSPDEIISLKDIGASGAVIAAAILHKNPGVDSMTQKSATPAAPSTIAATGNTNTVVYEYAPPVTYSYWQYPTYFDFGWQHYSCYRHDGYFSGRYGSHRGRR